jgi:CheY-like chemotaxis protein
MTPAVTTILIADDESMHRSLLRLTLDSPSYRIVEARSGAEAWRLLLEHRPRLAILDIRMPGRSGLELTQAIRQTPELASTRVVLLTVEAQPAEEAAGLAAGADAYIKKPFSPRELIELVDRLLAD